MLFRSVSNGELIPEFAPSILEYSLAATPNDEITITGIPEYEQAIVSGAITNKLVETGEVIILSVVSGDGTVTQNYSIKIVFPEISSVKSPDNKKIKIYPNPIRKGDILKIEAAENEIIDIIDMKGNIVKKIKITENPFNMSIDIPAGVYFVHFGSNDSNNSYKIVVE